MPGPRMPIKTKSSGRKGSGSPKAKAKHMLASPSTGVAGFAQDPIYGANATSGCERPVQEVLPNCIRLMRKSYCQSWRLPRKLSHLRS
jgi:hypothetical protein